MYARKPRFSKALPKPAGNAMAARATVSHKGSSTSGKAPLVVCDINNFFSTTGGGVRRYHLEKLRTLGRRTDLEYHVIVPSDRAEIERYGRAMIHHVPATPMGGSGYRMMLNPVRLRKLMVQIQPDVVEVGSPYFLPDLVRFACRGLGTRVVGFWHAHYPVAYMNRPVRKMSPLLAKMGERLGWWWARRTYGRFDMTMAAARCSLETLECEGVNGTAYTPLGVDLELFSPMRRDDELRATWGAGQSDVVLGFPHRLCDEKSLGTLIEAYELVRASGFRPHLVFAGNGPDRDKVEALVEKYPGKVHYLGYLNGREEVARLLASVDIVAALSPTETFGLSAAEAMASGAALIGSEELCVGEMLSDSRCGVAVPDRNAVAMANAWMELLKPGRARLLGARGAAHAIKTFDWSGTFKRICNVYHDVARPVDKTENAPLATPSRPSNPARFGASIAAMVDDHSSPQVHSRPTIELTRDLQKLRNMPRTA